MSSAPMRVCALCQRSFATGSNSWKSVMRRRWLPPSRRMSMLQGTTTRRDFTEQKMLGYKVDDVFRVLSDIDRYKEFLPWCQESIVIRELTDSKWIAKLSVGYPPVLETFTSLVILRPPTRIRSISVDGNMFSRLDNIWELQPGPVLSTGPSCVAHISTVLEFRSVLYANLAVPVFDEVAQTIARAFVDRCKYLYGSDHILSKTDSQTSNATHS